MCDGVERLREVDCAVHIFDPPLVTFLSNHLVRCKVVCCLVGCFAAAFAAVCNALLLLLLLLLGR